MDTILVINTGSSTIKFQLLAMPAEQRLGQGLIEGVGEREAGLQYAWGQGRTDHRRLEIPDHEAGVAAILALLREQEAARSHGGLRAVGHRVVHGGEAFTGPVLIDDEVIRSLDAMGELAPLHNRLNLAGIRLLREREPQLPQVAVFDTAFHYRLPAPARHYALPLDLQREHRIRRYGFHGLSHHYVADAAARWLERPLEDLRLVSLHLGNGASACAIDGGRSIDTSMGFTPLEGLVMGSRSGDLDPALPGYLARQLHLTAEGLEDLLNRHSGLKGLCGDHDMRRIESRMKQDDDRARLAFDLFCYRIRKYIGAYFAVLNGLDALIFTAGIGEHSAMVRSAVCAQLDALGIEVDQKRNAEVGDGIVEISPPAARVRVLVVPTDEEREIARATYACLHKRA